jgi:hypothetical protein
MLTVALTRDQAAITWLRPGRSVARRPCAGLEGPGGGLAAAVFDPHRSYRAYGYTEGANCTPSAWQLGKRGSWQFQLSLVVMGGVARTHCHSA